MKKAQDFTLSIKRTEGLKHSSLEKFFKLKTKEFEIKFQFIFWHRVKNGGRTHVLKKKKNQWLSSKY